MLVQSGGKWKLMSKSKPGKVLRIFGSKKPSQASLAKEERRIQFFKNLKHSSGGKGSLKTKVRKKSLVR